MDVLCKTDLVSKHATAHTTAIVLNNDSRVGGKSPCCGFSIDQTDQNRAVLAKENISIAIQSHRL